MKEAVRSSDDAFFFCFSVKKDVPPSAVTRPIYGILGTIRLVAGKEKRTVLFKNT